MNQIQRNTPSRPRLLPALPRPALLQPALLPLAVVLAWPAVGRSEDQALPRLPTVQVTAKGYAADALETPAATLVLTADELARRAAAQLGDALRGEPGVAVAADSAQGLNPVLRGLKKESLVLLVDGMRLNSAQPAGAVASFMTLGLAKRVELIKGPASVLYGSGALGGAVQVMLPQARFEAGLHGRISLRAGQADQGLHGAAVLNLASADHALMLGAAGARVHDFEDGSGREVARTGYDSQSLIAQYRWRLDARQQLRVSLQHQRDDDVWYPGSTRPMPNAALGTTTVYAPAQQRRLGELGYTWRRGGAGTGLRELDLRVYRQQMRRQISTWADQLARDTARTTVAFTTDGASARARWVLDAQHLLSFGVDAWQMSASPQRWVASPTPASQLQRNDPFAEGRIDALGVFVQDDWRLGAWSLLAGLRADHVEGSAAAMAGRSGSAGLSRRDSAPSGMLGLVYTAAPLWRPYAQIARGFRAAEMRERFEASPRGDGYFYLGNPQLEPEKALQLELGVKGADAGLDWSLAVYRNRLSDYITGRPTGAVQNGLPVKATVNLGRVTIQGLEAHTRWQAHPGHALQARLSLLRGTNEDLDEPLFQMPADELSLGWEAALAPGWQLGTTLRLVRRQDRVATRFTLGSEDATPGFVTADLALAWQPAARQQWRLALRNLADRAYHEHLSEGRAGHEVPAPGRQLVLSWQGSF